MLSLVVLIVILLSGYLYFVKSRSGRKTLAGFLDRLLSDSSSARKTNSNSRDVEDLRNSIESLSNTLNGQSYTFESLRQCDANMKRKMDAIERDLLEMKDKVKSLRQTSEPIAPKQNATEVHDRPTQESRNVLPLRIYASNPTSRNPFGFGKDDCSETDEGQVFVIERQTDTGGTVTINPEMVNVSRFISNIKYYSNIIDYTVSNSSNPTKIRVIDKGCVVMKYDVWAVIDKMKIEIN